MLLWFRKKLVYFPTNGDYALRDAIIALSSLNLLEHIFSSFSWICTSKNSNFCVYQGQEQIFQVAETKEYFQDSPSKTPNFPGKLYLV